MITAPGTPSSQANKIPHLDLLRGVAHRVRSMGGARMTRASMLPQIHAPKSEGRAKPGPSRVVAWRCSREGSRGAFLQKTRSHQP